MKSVTTFFLLLTTLTIAIYSCTAKKPYSDTNKIYVKQAEALLKPLAELPMVDQSNSSAYPIGTINFNLRKPNYVIIHHTAQNSCQQTLTTFTLTKTQVSAHYVICKDGTIHHMLNDYLRAWHAGIARWGSISDINSVSIGIELDNNGFEEFPESQLNSLNQLLSNLKKNYSIPTSNFIGHSDIAPARKQDPGIKFPWKKLSETGFGFWPDTVLDTVTPEFNALQGLRIIGYDVKDSTAAIIAFKRHFVQTDTRPPLTMSDKSIIKNLITKY